MQKNNHIHQFKRDTYSTGKKFYYCVNGNCTFKIDVRHSLGKFVLCSSCGDKFQMNEYSIRMAKPKCMDCIKRRTVNKELVNANSVVESSIKSAVVIGESIIKRLSEEPELVRESSLNDLRRKISGLTIKEYDPDSEDDPL